MILYFDLVAAALLQHTRALSDDAIRAALIRLDTNGTPWRGGLLAHVAGHEHLDPRQVAKLDDWARRYQECHRQATLLDVLERDGCPHNGLRRLVALFDATPPGGDAIAVLRKATRVDERKLVEYKRRTAALARAHEARELRRAKEQKFSDLSRPLVPGTRISERTLSISALFRSEKTAWLIRSEQRQTQAADASELFAEQADEAMFGFQPGSTLGEYTLGPALGEGGMGRVYLATRADGSHVAVKTLRAEFCEAEDHARFEREATILSRIDNGSVLPLLDEGTSEAGVRYLVFPALQGETMHDALNREGSFPLHTVFELAEELLSALSAVHTSGVIHKDLKPENVMLRDRAQPTRVCLIDFGLAHISGQETSEPRLFLTRDSDLLGTPSYLSPEQINGEAISVRSDLYAFGILLFRMLTGKLPFVAETAFDMLNAHVNACPLTLAAAAPNKAWSIQLQGLLTRLLSKDPDARPQSAAQVQDVLAECREALMPKAAPVPAPRPAPRARNRRKAPSSRRASPGGKGMSRLAWILR